ncbi:ATP-dependent Clp protease ATP-binding subunit CLPT2, chloroplastic [Coffea eugenioides]|uniref:ATP-dependent Clp protease ATP-binding subunit CLPT2, chloroplastic n=1 Tax=Coffea eugenioides TaxID=49369 RepID=UPI000F6150CA|nr:ATP-dependent Clp protease ATP-binding subunit CLPT2, chloroplastic [Coffea eugenioides]
MKMAAHTLSTPATTPPGISPQNWKHTNHFFTAQNMLKSQSHTLRGPWLGCTSRISVHSSNLRPFIQRHRPIKATVIFSLPTSNPERVASAEKVPKWSAKAIKSFVMSELEARKLKYPTTGTAALLMGILIEGTNFASNFLRANGITLSKVREETVKLLGKADMYFFSPEHPPLTEDAQRALDWAVDEKLKSGDDREVTTAHLLLGVWSQDESPGHKILAAFGFNDEKAQELKSVEHVFARLRN